jgi:hypothetical protein
MVTLTRIYTRTGNTGAPTVLPCSTSRALSYVVRSGLPGRPTPSTPSR